MRSGWGAGGWVGLLVVLAGLPELGLAQGRVVEPVVVRGAELVQISTPFAIQTDLRRMPRALEWRVGEPIREIPRRYYPRPGDVLNRETPRSPAQGVDPLMGDQARAPRARELRAFSAPVRNFDGHGFTGVNPPDTVGDVGPLHYIQMVNSNSGASFTIYDKSDGTIIAGPTTLDTLGSGECATGLGDPIVAYDQLADRWLMSEFSNAGNRLCVYLSQTADPVTGGWFNYSFEAPDFPDYPKYGAWPDAYYVTSNENPNPAVYAMERSKMLVGAPAGLLRFAAPSLPGFGFQALTPGDHDGAQAPPAGAPAYFVRHSDDERHDAGANDPARDFLELFEFKADFATPANSTFTGPTRIALAEFDSGLCGFTSFSCFPQPASTTKLDPLREVVMRRFQYRNFGSHETLVGNMVTDVDGTDRGGIRWYELRKSGAAAWTLFQQGTYSPDTTNRFMGSIAMDGGGNIALAYNVVGASVFPGIRYAGRLAGDGLGTLPQGEQSLVEGAAANSSQRYGDYSSLNVDPVDDCTFWFTGEYNVGGSWSTRIGAWSFAECGPQPEPLNVANCRTYCDAMRDRCATTPGIPAATCSQIVEACRQICAGQPPP